MRQGVEDTVSHMANYSSDGRRQRQETTMATRSGSAMWTGDVRNGSGRLTVGNDAWNGDYRGARFPGVLEPADERATETNPEELLAAAHAACFSMALSL